MAVAPAQVVALSQLMVAEAPVTTPAARQRCRLPNGTSALPARTPAAGVRSSLASAPAARTPLRSPTARRAVAVRTGSNFQPARPPARRRYHSRRPSRQRSHLPLPSRPPARLAFSRSAAAARQLAQQVRMAQHLVRGRQGHLRRLRELPTCRQPRPRAPSAARSTTWPRGSLRFETTSCTAPSSRDRSRARSSRPTPRAPASG